MTLTQHVIDRLKTKLKTIKTVKGAAEFEAAKKDRVKNTVYVMLVDESAGDNTLLNAVRQQVTTGVAVVIALTNYRDRRGAAGIDAIETVRDEVRQALLGWAPDDDSGVMVYRRGRLLDLQEATLWWSDEFEVQQLISTVR